MGIRFYCPNGHKLNVKAFQAGRQGICPYCGVSVQIPLESTRPSSKELRDQHDYPLSSGPGGSPSIGRPASSDATTPFQSPVLPQTAAVPQTQTFVAAMPPETAAPAVVKTPMTAMPYTPPQAAGSVPLASASPTTAAQPAWPPGLTRAEPLAQAVTPGLTRAEPLAPASAPPATPPALAGDPLTESPEAVWYVRPASGGQFGPAAADVMRGWLAEGRVGADTLVWREGWREWQEASATFPQLKPDEATEFFTGLSSGSMAPATTAAGGSHGQPLPSQRHSNASSAVIVVVLVVAVLVLLVVLVIALRQPPPDEKGPGAGTKAAALLLHRGDGAMSTVCRECLPRRSGNNGANMA